MKSMSRVAGALSLLWAAGNAAVAAPITIANPGFESNVLTNPTVGQNDNFIVSTGEGVTPVSVPGWTFGYTQTNTFSSYAGVSDLATGNHAPEGAIDNNILWLFIAANKAAATVTASQTLSTDILADTRYTLTMRVAQSAHAEGNPSLQNPIFPTLTDAVTGGNVLARLRVGNLATAMPGFKPELSSVSVPADDTWVNWTLVWETSPTETLTGPLVLQFQNGVSSVNALPTEVFFDDIALDATPVPEPGVLGLLGVAIVGLLCGRRRQ